MQAITTQMLFLKKYNLTHSGVWQRLQKAVRCITSATSDISPVDGQAVAVGEENENNQVHDAAILASPLVLENIFSDERSNRPDDSWGQPLIVWALSGSVW